MSRFDQPICYPTHLDKKSPTTNSASSATYLLAEFETLRLPPLVTVSASHCGFRLFPNRTFACQADSATECLKCYFSISCESTKEDRIHTSLISVTLLSVGLSATTDNSFRLTPLGPSIKNAIRRGLVSRMVENSIRIKPNLIAVDQFSNSLALLFGLRKRRTALVFSPFFTWNRDLRRGKPRRFLNHRTSLTYFNPTDVNQQIKTSRGPVLLRLKIPIVRRYF